MASVPLSHRLDLKRLFAPESVAVVGASDNPSKLGWHVMRSLMLGRFPGRIVPVNPGRGSVMGLPGARTLSEVDGAVDLVVVAVPAGAVPEVLTQCAEKRAGGIVLITAGFKEIDDPAGARLHEHVADIVGRAAIPVIGPNTFGMINRIRRLNASFTPEFSSLAPGRIALLSQSGGVSHLLGFLAMEDRVAFSKIVGLGNRLNVDFPEMVDHLMDDPDTGVILLYVEGIDAPGRLMAAARRHRGKKPVVVYKTGSSEKGDLAARSHTGSLAGRHEIYRGAFAQGGMLVTESAQALLDAGKALAGCPLPRGNGVAVLSGQAGPALAACDVCESLGLNVAAFTGQTRLRIEALLPPVALRSNPVDMGPAWYDATATRGIMEAAMDDAHVSGVLLLIMFASANRDMLKGLGDFLVRYAQRKPLISCILAPPGVWDDDIARLEGAGALVNFRTPERAAAAMAGLWRCRTLARPEER